MLKSLDKRSKLREKSHNYELKSQIVRKIWNFHFNLNIVTL